MAALVASQKKAIVRSVAGLRTIISCVKLMRSCDSNTPKDPFYYEKGDREDQKVWPDRELWLNPYYQMRFPLPGNVGPSYLDTTLTPNTVLADSKPSVDVDMLTTDKRHLGQAAAVTQFNMRQSFMMDKREDSSDIRHFDVEMKVQECPVLIRKDFQLLFPESNIMSGDFTIVSLCQQTENDMSGWSEKVESEREALLALYSEAAKELCSALTNAGFWADFLDVCSGKPALGPHTTDTMFETDERYRHFGFEIEDLGCCKVIKHHKWGTKSFVGCIFTNAPVDSPVLVDLLHFTHNT